ncbi:MAG: choice-of-anchor D domain-containing protein, partial [Pirellulaceae bacterium]
LAAAAVGAYSGEIQLFSDDSDDSPYNISLAGSVTAQPEISMFVGGSGIGDGVYVNYGLTGVGAPLTRTFTVRNDGGNSLDLTTLDANAMPAGFTLTSNLSDLALVNGETATFSVQLDATSAGSFSGQIQVVSNDQNENPFRINVLGTVGIPEISMFAGGSGIGDGVYIDYGSTPAGSPLTTTFTVRNDGSGTLNLSALDPSAMPAGFTLTSNLSSFTLYNGQTATFALRLDAASPGSYAGQIQVVSNDDNENPFRINVLGSVAAAPEITVTESGSHLTDGGSLSFGTTTVGTAVTRTFTVINDGSATLSLTPLDANSLPVGFSLAANLGSTSLAPGATTTFAVRLDAAAAGSYSGAIALANDDANENPFDLSISGTVNDLAAWSGPKLIDNGGSGWTKVGSWNFVTGKGRDNDIHRTAKGSGTVQSNWTFNDLPEGQYWVWASWTGNMNNASNAPFSVYDGTAAKVTWRVDQRTASSGFDADGTSWQYLGMVTINSGKMVVRLTNAANSYVVADAIRMDRATSQSPLPATSPRDAYFAQTQHFAPS